MKRKAKNMANVLLTLLLSVCLLAGCAGRENVPDVPGTGNAAGAGETRPGGDTAGGTECPEGYVYDYQVSMEPIPEEIAALGGPCEGTIHAFPSRIGMALTELEMEKDPVLKAEVEKRIPEIEAALGEEIGGEFVVDGVILSDDLGWIFFCTEVATGYQFDLHYANKEYYAYLRNRDSTENVVSVDYYYDEKESEVLREVLLPIIQTVYTDGDIKLRFQNGKNEIDIVIAQYTDNVVDKCLEQERILLLWEALQSYDNANSYNVNIVFYPSRYSDVIHQKYGTALLYDFGEVFSEKFIACLIEHGDILCCFNYVEDWVKKDTNNLDELLQKYKDGNYEQSEIWNYWIPQ